MKMRNPYSYLSLALLAAIPIGCKKSDDTAADPNATTPTPTAGAKVGMGGPVGGMAGSGGAPAGPGSRRPVGAPGSSPIPGGKPANAVAAGGIAGQPPGAKVVTQPGIKVAPDPFYASWHVTPVPYIFDEVQPIRLASANVTMPPKIDTEVREVPTRRVSGIMSGDGIYAILEGGAEIEIVKPGSITQDGYRVVSINSNSVKLQRREGNYLLTQIVPLTDIPASAQTAGFQGGGARGGFPGARGGFPGGQGGFPGGGQFGGGGRRGEE